MKHKLFSVPPNNTKVWKYMDFIKFVNLLDTSSLFFCRIDKLGDQFEGIVPDATINRWKLSYKNSTTNKEELEKKLMRLDKYINFLHQLRKCHIVNCWHKSEFESAAMWRIYKSSNLGIAIQSNVQNLIQCFEKATKNIHIGQINYTGFDNDSLNLKNTFYPTLNKLISYNYEYEIRAVIFEHKNGWQQICEKGILIQINLNKLIEKIYISPNVPDSFLKVVTLLLKDKLTIEVVQSSLKDKNLH